LVTGGGSGLGRAAALGLARGNANVVVIGRRQDWIDETVTLIHKQGGKGCAIKADILKYDNIIEVFNQIEKMYGCLDILVNSAGINVRKTADEITVSDWDLVVSTNLKGMFFCCQAAARLMKNQRRGRIINIGSLTSERGVANMAPYCASKGGVLMLTRALAIEWAEYGINVNAIGPGQFRVEKARSLFENENWLKKQLTRIPKGRVGEPDDLVGTVLYLSSPLSEYVTGQIIYVDGGMMAGSN